MCNGQVERQNKTLITMLKCYVQDNPHDWPKYTYQMVFAYNTTPHTEMGNGFITFFNYLINYIMHYLILMLMTSIKTTALTHKRIFSPILFSLF
jgi:hypothetical protein